MRPTVPAILVVGDDDQGNVKEDLLLQCGACLNSFVVGDPAFVTTANKKPICAKCIQENNPKRVALGLPPMPFDVRGYVPFGPVAFKE